MTAEPTDPADPTRDAQSRSARQLSGALGFIGQNVRTQQPGHPRAEQSRVVAENSRETSFTEEVRQRISGIELVLTAAHENICAATSRTFGPVSTAGNDGADVGQVYTTSVEILRALDALMELAMEHRDLAATLNRKL